MTRLQISLDIENVSNVKDQRVLVNRSVQHALDRVYQYHDFPYYMQDKGVIKTVADYSTGTVTATQDSKTITGDSTVFTAAMVGRKIRVGSSNTYYRIAAWTSVLVITLEEPYQGDTEAGASYVIYKDEYRLMADVDKYKTFRQMQNAITLFDSTPTNFDKSQPAPQSYSDPTIGVLVGTKLDVYTTGSLSASTKTLTGVSTSWDTVEGLGRMTQIRIGNDVYTVKSVDSSIQITLYETVVTPVAAGTSYEITLNNLIVQVNPIPADQRILYYRYFRLPTPLANDYDIPDMPNNWHWLLMYGGLSIILMQKGDINKAQLQAEERFVRGLEQMKLKIGSFAPDRLYHLKSQDRMRSTQGRIDGFEASSFDRRYSS